MKRKGFHSMASASISSFDILFAFFRPLLIYTHPVIHGSLLQTLCRDHSPFTHNRSVNPFYRL